MQAALHAAALLARERTRPQFVAFYRRDGLIHLVNQQVGCADEALIWAAENVTGRYGCTPTDVVWRGMPLWGFADPDDAFQFKIRWG